MKKALEPVEKTAVITKKSAKNGAEPEFRTIEPKILYFGTPVALVSSLNEDGTTDLAPISSFWALGWTMTLGLLTETKTAENFERHRACVVNLPSPEMWEQVERLAPLTAKNPVPELKKKQFHYEPAKIRGGGVDATPERSCEADACERVSGSHGGARHGAAQIKWREARRTWRRSGR